MNIKRHIGFTVNVTLRQLPFFYRIELGKSKRIKEGAIIGLMRERNESLLLEDSLNHLSKHVDGIVVFDDASTDDSVKIALNHPKVVCVVRNKFWRQNNRIWEETSNRQKLYSVAKKYKPEWLFYADADERFEGDIKEYLTVTCPQSTNAIRISLFDAYITGSDKRPYGRGGELYNLRKYFGPERRDILMIWRNLRNVRFNVPDAREPQEITGDIETRFFCQHYGKSLSIEQWEETCEYYIKFFPKYSEKWKARKGKAVHDKSDFGRELYVWGDVKNNSVEI